ncbi:hypothetical protein QFC21_001859 [Naganishia friedmannii]|uniref:Uncharacterized protein n=1 Tax=Naganishia friedmannii TaxID=89922 RepID=A0ACC2W1D3_9TREE|nr:hypothetical protein QFC21_001859 [Naganishia friedmannii]
MRIGEMQLQRVPDGADGGGRLGEAIGEALQVIDDVLDDYGEEHVAMSFNGGKDSALYRRNRSKLPEAVGGPYTGDDAPASLETTIPPGDRNAPPPPPPLYRPIIALYITAPNPFPALETFVASAAEYYSLDLRRYGGGGMKRALAEFQESEGGEGCNLYGEGRGEMLNNIFWFAGEGSKSASSYANGSGVATIHACPSNS